MADPTTARDLLEFQRGGGQQDIASYLMNLLMKAGKMEDKIGYTYDLTSYNPTSNFTETAQSGEEDIENILGGLFSQEELPFQEMRKEDIERLIKGSATMPSFYTGEKVGPMYGYGPQAKRKYSNFSWETDTGIADYLGIQGGLKELNLEDIQSRLSKELFLTESKRKRKEGDIRRKYTGGEAQSRYAQLAGEETDDMSIGDLLSSFSALGRKSARGSRGIQEKYDEEILGNAMKWLESMV